MAATPTIATCGEWAPQGPIQAGIPIGDAVVLHPGEARDNDVPLLWSQPYQMYVAKMPIDVLGPPGTTVLLRGRGLDGGTITFQQGSADGTPQPSAAMTVASGAGGQSWPGVVAVSRFGVYEISAESGSRTLGTVELSFCRLMVA